MYFPYCVKCLKQPTLKTETAFYDYRFELPTCLECVEEYGLEPELEPESEVGA
jgi:hypothetical protein